MELRHLHHFVAVADEGSFTKAARRVNIVQSGVSSSIRELEEEVGVRLFDRTTRTVVISDSGKIFLEHVRAGLASIDAGLHAVRDQDDRVRGRLRIGVLQSQHPYLDMPLVLKGIRDKHPDLDIEVRTLTADAVPETVRSGELDLSFHAIHGSAAIPGVQVIPFVKDTLVAICAQDHELASKGRVSMETIASEVFVDLVPGRATRKMIDREFSIRDLHRHTAIEVGEVQTIVQFVSRGLGVAIVPSVLAHAYPESGRLAVLNISDRQPKLAKWGLAIVVKVRGKNQGKLKTVEVFLETLKRAPSAITRVQNKI